jgi:tRNA 2-selenouridine synthase
MVLSVSDFLEARKKFPLIDVRTPAEYKYGHIPGALNIPLLSDDERVEVGTLYKNKGKEAAFLRALELTGPKMADYVRQMQTLMQRRSSGKVIVHCWRGGMRSASMAWLFNTAGFEADTIEKGYKAYRNHILSIFDIAKEIIVLGGYTGSGKTEILKYINRQFQTSDLEKFAHHKGSAFGFIGESSQPTTEQFENELGEEWIGFDTDQPVWVEDESRTIGKVYLPDNLYAKIRNSPVLFIDVPKEIRIKRLVKDYAGYDKALLKIAIDKILVRLGGQNHKAAIEALEKDDFENVADITLSYYDKAYLHGLSKRDQSKVHRISVDSGDAEENAGVVMESYNSIHK